MTTQTVGWSGSQAIEVDVEDGGGRLNRNLAFRDDEQQLEIVTVGWPRSFERDGRLYSLERWHIKHTDLNRWIDARSRGGDGGRDGN